MHQLCLRQRSSLLCLQHRQFDPLMPAAPVIPGVDLMPAPAIQPPMPAPVVELPMPAASAIEPSMPAATAVDPMPAASIMPTPIPAKSSPELVSLTTNYVGVHISMEARHARKSWLYRGIDGYGWSIPRLGIG